MTRAGTVRWRAKREQGHIVFLHTLGGSELRAGQEPSPPLLSAGKPFALLTYLSAAPHRTASRSSLVSLLWADLEPDAAKHALRQTIWYLRRKTGTDLIAAVGDSLQLNEGVTVDRDGLMEASVQGDHDLVVALYTGSFIPAFAAPGGAGFEEWCALERRRLLEIFRHSADAVIGTFLSRGHARDAIDLARRLRDQDLYNESGWRLLIESCVSGGDLLAAKMEAEALQQLSDREELQLEPATRALMRIAREQTAVREASAGGDAPSTSAITGTLVGREAAFASLLNAWERARDGHIVRRHVTARAGIGKTRLLRDFASRLRGLRAKVITVGGSTGTRDIPFSAASDLAAGLAVLPGRRSVAPESAATLVALNPSLSTYFEVAPHHVAAHEALRARSLAIRELLTAVAFEHTVAILVDDLHWWDEASVSLLKAVMDGLREVRVLLVTASRPEGDHTLPPSADDEEHLIALQPLSAVQVEELVLSIAALPNEVWATDFSTELWRASRGSPLLALEMLQLLEDHGLLGRMAGTWATARPEALSEELRAGNVLRARLETMERGDRWLLTLLGAAGSPIDSATIAAAAERPMIETVQRLSLLEARGLVVEDASGWQISHDEITEELRRLTSRDGMSRASVRVGRALLSAGPFTDSRARRVALLIRDGDDPVARSDLFRLFAVSRFEMGDRRSLDAFAVDLFGPDTRTAEMRELRLAMPWTLRLGLVSRMRRWTAALGTLAVVVILLVGMLTRPAPPPPDAVLGLVFLDDSGRTSFARTELRTGDWTPQEPLEVQPWDAIAPFSIVSPNAFSAVWAPASRTLYTAQSVDDEGTIEIFRHQGTRPPERLQPSPGDDQSPALSPDGARLAFSTARWDTLSHYDLAVVDLRDESVHRATGGPSTDHAPVWAPDGSRLAFARHNWGEQPDALCVGVADARETPECWPTPEGVRRAPLGWLDEHRIVYLDIANVLRRIRILDTSSGESTSITEASPGDAFTLSPDGRWMFCECRVSLTGNTRPSIVPLANPLLARQINAPDARGRLISAFWIASAASTPAARARIDRRMPLNAPAGVPLKLSATVQDAYGATIPYVGNLRWSLRDTLAGTIDPTSGVLVANGTTSTIRAIVSAGSAQDTLELPVTPDSNHVVLRETWADTLMSNWILFGVPVPRVVNRGASQWAFLNNGEGSFNSGAISRQAYELSYGLAVDVEVSLPVTSRQWQALSVLIVQQADTARYARARGRNVPPAIVPGMGLCGGGFPQEGQSFGGMNVLSVASVTAQERINFPTPGWTTGEWHHLRFQYLPDGRCGIALDGVPVVVLPGRPVIGGQGRALIAGNSVGTQALVGALTITQGVPSDVDWTRARAMP